MKLRRRTKPALSVNDRQWIKKKVEANLSVETLERREMLAADLIGGLSELAEGEGSSKVQMRLVATDLSGQPVDKVVVNQNFNLQGYVTDLRDDPRGVFTSYMDVEFNKTLVQATGAIQHGGSYSNFQSGTIDVSGALGVIDEVGGMAGMSELGAGEHLVFTVPMRATAAGNFVFDGNPADVKPAHQVLVYGENDEVTDDLITIVDYALEVSDTGILPYTEDFNDGTADGMTVTQGTFAVSSGRYISTPPDERTRSLSVVDLTVDIPAKTRFQTTINLEYASGLRRNAYQVFAYQDNNNYKIAGLNANAGRWVIGEFVNGSYRALRQVSVSPAQNVNYQLELVLEGKKATLHVDGRAITSHTFDSNLNVGKFGLLAIGARSRFDNVHIAEIFPTPIAVNDAGESVINTAVTIDVLANDSHERAGTPLHIISVDGVDNGVVELQDTNQDNKADRLVFTPAAGFSGAERFSYVVGDGNGQTDSASVLVDVLPGIPMTQNFNTVNPAGFEVVQGNWAVANSAYVAQSRRSYSLVKIRTGVENPTEVEFSATVSMPRVSDYISNVDMVFDYVNASNYKFVGGSVDNRQWYLGQVVNGQRTILQTKADTVTRDEHEFELVIRGTELEFIVDDVTVLTRTYQTAPNAGLFGFGANRAKPIVDKVKIREFVPAPIAEDDATQTVVNVPVDIAVLANDGHDLVGTSIYVDSVVLEANGTTTLKDTNNDGKNDTVTFTPAADFRGIGSFDYIVKDNNGQEDQASVSVRVAADLPLYVDFNDNQAVDFSFADNQWRVSDGQFLSTSTRGTSIATTNLGVALPGKYMVGVTQTPSDSMVSGFVFDYTDSRNYKFARQTNQGFQIGQVVNGRASQLRSMREFSRNGQAYELELHVENSLVTLYSNGVSKVSHTFTEALNDGQVGLYTNRTRSRFDDFFVKEILPTPIAEDDATQTIVNTPITINVLANDSHDIPGTEYGIVSVTQPAAGSVTFDSEDGTVTFTPAANWRGLAEFTYTVADDAHPNRLDRGSVSVRVAADLPLYVDFNDNQAVDFSFADNQWRVSDGQFLSTSTRGTSIATTNLGVALPGKYMVGVTQTPSDSMVSGFVFDYTDSRNYKFARQTNQGFQIGQVVNGRASQLRSMREFSRNGQAYELELHVENSLVTLYSNGVSKVSHTFTEALNDGQVGLYTNRTRSRFDDFFVKEIVPTPIAEDDATQTIVNTPVTIDVTANDYHEREGDTFGITSLSGVDNGTVQLVDHDQDGKMDRLIFTPANNYRGIETFNYVIEDDAGYSDTGRVEVTVASELPIQIPFTNNEAPDLVIDESNWTISDEKLISIGRGTNRATVLIGEALPQNFQTSAQINIQRADGYYENAYLMVNYQDDQNYVYAGANQRDGRWVIAEVRDGRTTVLAQNRQSIATRTNYDVTLRVEGDEALLIVDGTQRVSYTFGGFLNGGQVGVLTNRGRSYFDNIVVEEYVVRSDAIDDRAGAGINETITINVLANDYAPNGKLDITGVSAANNSQVTPVDSDQDGLDDAIRFVPDTNYEGLVTFTYDVVDPKQFTDTATVTVRVADALNYVEDFDDNLAQDFTTISGVWQVENQHYRTDGNGEAISIVDLGEPTPTAVEVGVTVNAQPNGGSAQNGMIIFNYVDPNNYRYAGALVGGGSWVIGERVNGTRRHLRRISDSNIAAERDLAITLLYENDIATLRHGNNQVVQWQFADSVLGADLGLLTFNAVTDFDDFFAREGSE